MTAPVAGARMGPPNDIRWYLKMRGLQVPVVPDPNPVPRAAYRSLRVLANIAALDAAGKRVTAALLERTHSRGGRVQILGTLDDLEARGLIAKWCGESSHGIWVYACTLAGLQNLRDVIDGGRCQAVAVGLMEVVSRQVSGKEWVDPVLGEDGSDA